MKKAFLYFFIAALPVALQQADQPADPWEWWRFIGGVLLAGFVALKALDSNPPDPAPKPAAGPPIIRNRLDPDDHIPGLQPPGGK